MVALSATNATNRFNALEGQGTTGGNWSVRSAISSSPDLSSGNLQIEQLLTVLSQYDATNLGYGSISTRGGIDCALNFYGGQSATFLQNVSAGQNGNFGNNVTLGNLLTASMINLSGIAANALYIPNGGLTASSITSNSLFTAMGSTSLQGTTQVSGPFSIITNTASTTPNSGSCLVTGGVGVGGAINAAGNISSLQNINATGQLQASTGIYTSTQDATSTNVGSLSTLGGGSFAKSLYVGTDFYSGGSGNSTFRFKAKSSTNEVSIVPDGNNSAIYANTTNVIFGPTLASVMFESTANATNFTNGAVQILGGMSVAQDSWLHGQLFLNGPVTGTSSVTFNNSTVSTSPSNGAVIISGGLGVNQVTVGSTLIAGLSAVQSATNVTSGNLQSRGGLGVVGDAYVGATLNITGQTNLSSVYTTAGGSIGGSLTVVGSSLLENDVTISSSTVPTSTSTPAALSITGGSVIVGNSFYQNNLSIGNQLFIGYNNANSSQLYFSGPSAVQASLGFNTTYNSVALIAPNNYPIRCVSNSGFAFVDGTDVTSTRRFSASSTQVLVNNPVDCSTLGTAGFVTNSGASIALSTIIGKTLTVQSNLDATSFTSSSLVVAGGAAITKSIMIGAAASIGTNANVGGNLAVTGTTLLSGLTTLSAALTSSSIGSFAGALIAGGTISAQSSANSSWQGPSSSVSPTGSLVSYGGGVIEKDFYVGGNETVFGNTSLQGTCTIAGVTTLTSPVTSSSPSNQALVVTGGTSLNSGVLITGATVAYGDVFVGGKLVVNGTQTWIESQNTLLRDNIIALNIGSRNLPDCGIAFGRDQEANNNAAGFIITDTPAYTFTVASSASDLLTVNLPSSSSTVLNFYQNCWIMILSGTGAGQVRFVDSSSGSAQTLTIRSSAQQATYNTQNPPPTNSTNPVIGLDFATAPDSTSVIAIYNNCYGMLLQQQLGTVSEWRLGYTTMDTMGSINNASLTKYGFLRLATVAATTSIQSDQYQAYTSGDSIVLNNSVTVSPTGALTGVKSINGAPAQLYFAGLSVAESALNATGATTIPISNTYGTIKYVISSPDGTGSTSSGSITCNQTSTTNGTPNTATTALQGTNGEQVGIVWQYGSAPQLTLFMSRPTANQTGNPIIYNISLTVQ